MSKKEYTYTYLLTFKDGTNRFACSKHSHEEVKKFLTSYTDFLGSVESSVPYLSIGKISNENEVEYEIIPYENLRSMKVINFKEEHLSFQM